MNANLETGDLIGTAVAREREHRRVVWPMEQESAQLRVFKCVCCGKVRREESRRERWSEVCVHCVGEAGFVE
jgi:hypothetical protein